MRYMVGDIEPTDAKLLMDAARDLVGQPNGQPLEENEYFVAVRKRDFERLRTWVDSARQLTEDDGATPWDVAYPELFGPSPRARTTTDPQ